MDCAGISVKALSHSEDKKISDEFKKRSVAIEIFEMNTSV